MSIFARTATTSEGVGAATDGTRSAPWLPVPLLTRVVVLKAILKMHWIEARRYWLNTIMRLALSYVLFLTIFLGVRMTVGDGEASGDPLSAVVVGLMVWILALRAFRGISGRLSTEATMGTLEQLAMSPLGLGRVLVCRALVEFVVQLVLVLMLLFMMMATTGKWLHLHFLSILPLLFLTVAGVQGIGFAMGGLALVFKRITSVFLLFQYLFVALIAVPVDANPLIRWLPLSWGSHLLRRVMVEGESLLEIPPESLLLLVVTSTVYFGLGFIVFKFFERQARERGLLGHY